MVPSMAGMVPAEADYTGQTATAHNPILLMFEPQVADLRVMRAARISLLLLMSVVVLGGCQMRVEQRFEVNDDGSGTIEVVTLFDEEAQELVTFGMGFEAIVQDAPAGFEAAVVEDGDLAGTAMSAEFSTLDEIRALTQELSEEGGMGSVNVRQAGDAFIFQMALPDEGLTVDGTDMADFADFGDFGGVEGMDELNDAIQFRVVAVLPGHIADSNADEVDGDTAVWTISMLSPPTEMLFASSLPGSGRAFPVLWILGAIAAGALAFVTFRWWQRNSKPPGDDLPAAAASEALIYQSAAPSPEAPETPPSNN
jgi:hypothetical protein